jgi:two-component system, chemotaxis family, protein-glutamate methylesterase/glutaminase
VRRLVSKALEQEGSVEVVGVAADGRIALMKIPQLEPDVVLLDVEMPTMDGLACLSEIRKRWPKLTVIMFSTLTTRAAAATLDALSIGASDYVPKPRGLRDPSEGFAYVKEQLVPRILALCPATAKVPIAGSLRPPARRPAKTTPSSRRPAVPGRIDVLAIGASTGGPNALMRLLERFPASLQVPVLIVQHMPPLFTRLLADRLTARTSLRVREAADGDMLVPGEALVAPGDLHMVVEPSGPDVRVSTYVGPPENSCRPSVDPLFRSVAGVFGRHALGVVLTGMGKDGLGGAESIRAARGQLVVQDEASSVVWGMPGFVARAGLADAVVSIDDMAADILGRLAMERAPLRLARSAAR